MAGARCAVYIQYFPGTRCFFLSLRAKRQTDRRTDGQTGALIASRRETIFRRPLFMYFHLTYEARAGPTRRIESVATPQRCMSIRQSGSFGSDTPEGRSINVRIQKFAATHGTPS